MLNECFPLISVRIFSRDLPFISPLVKNFLKFRNRLQKRSKPLPVGLEDRITHLISEKQRQAVKQESCTSGRGSRAWWSTVNTITGRDTQPQLISSVSYQDAINEYFCSINSDPEYVPLHKLISLMMQEYLEYLFMLSQIFFPSLRGLLVARMKFRSLGRWHTSSLYQRSDP